MIHGAHRDSGDEGRDQAVADRHVREAEGREAESNRVDPLVAAGDPTSRQVVVQTPAEGAHRHAHHPAECGLAQHLEPLAAGVAAGLREGQEEQDEGKREPVIEPRLQVQRVADQRGHALRRDDGRGDDGVGRRQHRGQQERLRPRQVRKHAVPDQGAGSRA